ncbi:MAG: hypothetical protein M1817_001129 [Caeruleum heppii]|nr:MAG: hypothetical protein M1817_001129 [Caeruleum heppii]
MPPPGFQALILCGPGVSLNTFTSSPDDHPKALFPIANRPMVWYPLDWCYRMGVTKIHLITPPSSAKALEAAFSINPHLTSLPTPKPDILAPDGLSQNTGTAQIFRLPEVQAVITDNFIVLPCDLLCELGGESLLESWMIQCAGLGGSSGDVDSKSSNSARLGGIGVYYDTKGPTDTVKGEETDFLATAPAQRSVVPSHASSLLPHISPLVYAMPTDTLNDITTDKKSFFVRHALLRKHARVKMLTTRRDAHLYFFPRWVLEMIRQNESFDSVSEDVVGWWAKAGWQSGLADKLGLRETFAANTPEGKGGEESMLDSGELEEKIDLAGMSTTWTSNLSSTTDNHSPAKNPTKFASRVRVPDSPAISIDLPPETPRNPLTIPPILAYLHPSSPSAPILRRCDTTPLLLTLSLRLARLPGLDDPSPSETGPHPFSHAHKIPPSCTIPARSTVTRPDCLLADNVLVAEKCVIKECVLGASCEIGVGARLTRCVLMDGVVVGEKVTLSGCVVGKGAKVGSGSVLRDCEVQEGFAVPDETDTKNEKFMVFEGLEGDLEDEEMGGEGLELDDGDGGEMMTGLGD